MAKRTQSGNKRGPSSTATATGRQGRGRGPGAALGGRQGQRALRPANRPPARDRRDGAGPQQPTTDATGPRTRPQAPRPNGPHKPPASYYLHPAPQRGITSSLIGGRHQSPRAATGGSEGGARPKGGGGQGQEPTRGGRQPTRQHREQRSCRKLYFSSADAAAKCHPPKGGGRAAANLQRQGAARRRPHPQRPRPSSRGEVRGGDPRGGPRRGVFRAVLFQTPSPSEIVSHPAR